MRIHYVWAELLCAGSAAQCHLHSSQLQQVPEYSSWEANAVSCEPPAVSTVKLTMNDIQAPCMDIHGKGPESLTT